MIKFVTALPYKNIPFTRATIEEVRNWSKGVKSILADTETTGLNPHFFKMLLLIMGDENVQYVIDLRSIPKDEVRQLLEDTKHMKWVFHNSKFDYSFIKIHYGVELRNLYCTFLASQILSNGLDFDNSLKNLVDKLCHVQLDKQARNSFINKSDNEPFTEEEIHYAANDVQYLKQVATCQMEFIRRRDQEYLIQLENQVTPVIANMELKGIDFDIPAWKYLAKNNKTRAKKVELLLDREVKRLSLEFELLRGGEYTRQRKSVEIAQLDMFGAPVVKTNRNLGNINWGSSDQIIDIFDRCGIQLGSASQDALQIHLKEQPNTPCKKLIELLLYYSKIKKQISTYGDSFLEFINPVTGRIHTNFTQCYTDTGRFSSGDAKDDDKKKLKWFVNFQNIPAIQAYRSCFTVPSPDYEYITLDLSGAEIVIAASNSQDPLIMKSITDGLDLHSTLATRSYTIISKLTGKKFNIVTQIGEDGVVTITKKDKDLRDAHKPVLFGIMYKAGAQRISEILDIPLDVAEKVLNGIFGLLPTMKLYLDKTGKDAVRKGYIISNNITKRRRYFSQEMRDDKAWKIEKEACNFPIQGTNADMVKMALVEIDKHLRDNNLDAWLVNTVHDEISVVSHKQVSEQVFKDVQRIMQECANKFLTNITMSSSGGKSSSWTK
jgi:DNA polymerase-1